MLIMGVPMLSIISLRLKNRFFLLFIFAVCGAVGKNWSQPVAACALDEPKTIASLKSSTLLFPEYSFGGDISENTIITFSELRDLFAVHTENACKQLSYSDVWVNKKKTEHDGAFPFVQKLIIPAGSTAVLFGDLHGSWHSLMRSLERLRDEQLLDNNFTLIKPNCYLIFLGDYSDRVPYSVEVLYAVLRLKVANPQRVILLRGNHENSFINMQYGLFQEMCRKFGSGQAYELMKSAVQSYNYMPVALYLGSGQDSSQACRQDCHIDYVLCCHGGLEIGFSPRALLESTASRQFFLLDKLERSRRVEMLPEDLKNMVKIVVPESERQDVSIDCQSDLTTLGFLWNDMIVDDRQIPVAYTNGRGWAYGKLLVQFLLEHDSSDNYTINAIFRGHQHNSAYGNMLERLINGKGMWALWDGLAFTLFSSPAMIPQVRYDSLLFIKTAQRYKDWSVKHSAVLI